MLNPGRPALEQASLPLLKQKATDNDTVHHTDFHRPLCGHDHFGPCLRHGRQAQAHLPGHLFHRGGRGRHRGAIHQDRGILGRPADGEPRAEVFGQHRQLLRVHKPAHCRRTDAGRRLCDTQAGRVRAQAVRGCDGRPARVPILRLFPVLQRPDVHGQRMLPDHYAGIKKKQPVLFRRQEVARLPREDTQGA